MNRPEGEPLLDDAIQQKWMLPFEQFLAPAELAALFAQLQSAPAHQAQVYKAAGGQQTREADRKTAVMTLPKALEADLAQRLLALRPQLEAFFGIEIQGLEAPAVLRYSPGDYYRAHIDWHPNLDAKADLSHMSPRQLSVVLFLNRRVEQVPRPEEYTGGELVFHLPNPARTLVVDALAGTLLTFRPELVHEVREVYTGDRYTLISWFY